MIHFNVEKSIIKLKQIIDCCWRNNSRTMCVTVCVGFFENAKSDYSSRGTYVVPLCRRRNKIHEEALRNRTGKTKNRDPEYPAAENPRGNKAPKTLQRSRATHTGHQPRENYHETQKISSMYIKPDMYSLLQKKRDTAAFFWREKRIEQLVYRRRIRIWVFLDRKCDDRFRSFFLNFSFGFFLQLITSQLSGFFNFQVEEHVFLVAVLLEDLQWNVLSIFQKRERNNNLLEWRDHVFSFSPKKQIQSGAE